MTFFTPAVNALKNSSQDGLMSLDGSKKPYLPVSLNSTVKTYLIPAEPLLQSSVAPEAASTTKKYGSMTMVLL